MITITNGRDFAYADALATREDRIKEVTLYRMAERASTIYERLRKRAYRRTGREIYYTQAEANAYREGARDALTALVNSFVT